MAVELSEGAKLTPVLFQIFRRYKKATNTVIEWLVDASDNIGRGRINTAWSLKQLRQAAERVRSRNITLPDNVSWAFAVAIDARAVISTHFKQQLNADHQSTQSHEYCTNTLKQIFSLLRKSSTERAAHVTSPKQPLLNSTNPYDVLVDTVEATPDMPLEARNEATEHFNPNEDRSDDGPAEETFTLRNDALAIDFEVYYAITNLDMTCTRIKSYWEKVANASMSPLLASWLTTAAYQDAKYGFNGGSVSKALGDLDHNKLCERHASFIKASKPDQQACEANSSSNDSLFFTGPGLYNPWKAVLDTKGKHLGKTSREFGVENPDHYITVSNGPADEARQVTAERQVIDMLLKSIKVLLLPSKERLDLEKLATKFPIMVPKEEERMNFFIFPSHPLVEEIKDFCSNKGSSIKTNVIFGMQLLVESYKSSLFASGKVQMPNYRKQTLQFAQDVLINIRKVFSVCLLINRNCHCSDCCCNSLWRITKRLEGHLMMISWEKRFDLYHQNPWVAGSQTLSILSRAAECGVRLCNRGQFVGTVLHLYNFLWQFGYLDTEDVLLERLCTVIGQDIFHGPRPVQGFQSRYIVFLGGRLQFERPKRNYSDHDHDHDSYESTGRTWRLATPTGSRKSLHFHRISLLAGLNNCRFSPSCYSWAQIWHGNDRIKSPTKKMFERACTEIAAHPFVCTLDHMETAGRLETEGEFPAAKINWFQVYLTCTEILGDLAALRHGDSIGAMPEPKIISGERDSLIIDGQKFVQRFLPHANEYQDKTSASAFLYDRGEAVGDAISAIRGVLKGEVNVV